METLSPLPGITKKSESYCHTRVSQHVLKQMDGKGLTLITNR